MISLDNLASRYGVLPSEALSRASTLDLKVLDVSAKWAKRQNDIAEGKLTDKVSPKLSQEQMLAMINKVRGDNES